MTTIKYHPDVHGYAVNVKTLHMHFADGGTEGQRELAWDSTHEDWWNDANEIARQEGFSGVSAVGRSCGWCAPYYENHAVPNNRSNFYRYVQSIESEEDVLDADEKEEAKRFGKFAERIEEHLKDVPAMYKENLERIIAEDAAEEAAAIVADKEEHDRKVAALGILQGVDPALAEYWRKQWGLAK